MDESVNGPLLEENPTNSNSADLQTTSNSPQIDKVVSPNDESALEDRYNKLKVIAVKLKKRIGEQTDEIERLKDENVKIVGKSQKVSTIQQEFDKAQDEIEKLRKLNSTLEKDLKGSVEENVKIKEANFEHQSQVQSLTTSHKFLREKCERLEKSEEEMLKWKNRVEELESGLKEAKQTEMDAMQEKRQTAMLSLEITDYEKKLQDMREKLDQVTMHSENQEAIVADAEKKVETYEQTIGKLNNTIEDLNRSKTHLESDIVRKSEKINFLQDEVSKSNDKVSEVKSELSKLNKEYENAKFNFSSETRTLLEKCGALEKVIRLHENKISALEENKRSRESFISNLKLELNQVETEFSNYKLKAQAMLKTQKPDTSKNSDELENLQKIVQEFNSEISVLKSENQTLKLENESLVMERMDLGVQLSHIKTDCIQKEVALGSEVQKFRQELRQKDVEIKNATETAKTEKEAIITAYKVQLENLKRAHEMRTKGLEDEIMNLKHSWEENHSDSSPQITDYENAQGNKLYEDNNQRTDFAQRCTSADYSLERRQLSANNSVTQPLTIDTSSGSIAFDQIRMIPRGECEGSESISSPHLIQTSDNYNLTFEQLLSSDTLKNNEETQNHLFGPSLKEELVRCQNQIKHLTVLLRESESNSERLAQLSEALKEEIRRVERDNERKVHLKENTEYLKNVLLKFVTLQGEDEKLRLVPVLKTMLRLAPAEVAQIETSVKGIDIQQHPPDGNNPRRNSGAAGWSSYLPMWH